MAMRNFVVLGMVSLAFAGMAACGDDDTGDGPGLGGSGGSAKCGTFNLAVNPNNQCSGTLFEDATASGTLVKNPIKDDMVFATFVTA